MVLSWEFEEPIRERAGRDPAFAKAMLDEAATAVLDDEAQLARLIVRGLVNASIGV